jgi:dTDP-4-amino-4,6-dideoxygalactose transaminase
MGATAIERPASLGGPPAFPQGLPLARPPVPDPELAAEDLRDILESGVLTNGPRARALEERVADYLGVRHCIAVSSCTAGLILALGGLQGAAVVPSFTFPATVHAAVWAGLRPVFADVNPGTLTMDPQAVRRAAREAAAVVATHVFGTPCDVAGLESSARELGARLVFDAAHALGSRVGGAPVGGRGDAEVFSLTPTKLVTGSEGGLIATNLDHLAERCRLGREYGNPGDYDTRFPGLNARMSEIHAAIALRSFVGLDRRVERRNALAAAYREALAGVPGLSFPSVRAGDLSTYKDFTVLVDPDAFGLAAPGVGEALAAEGVETRRYYAPPVHRQQAYAGVRAGELPVTEGAAARVLTLPLWDDMDGEPAGVAEALIRIHAHAPALAGGQG